MCSTPLTPASVSERPDPTIWQFWWGHNRDAFLQLHSKRRSHDGIGCWFVPADPHARLDLWPSEKLVRGKVVPVLLHTLRTESSTLIVPACLIALAKIGEAQSPSDLRLAEAILPHLASEDQTIQETAAIALGILGELRDIPWLEAIVGSDVRTLRGAGVRVESPISARTRAFAAFGLGLIGQRAQAADRHLVVQVLMRHYERERHAQVGRDVAVACLNSIGLTPLPFHEGATKTVDLRSMSLDWPARTRQEQIAWLANPLGLAAVPELDRAQVPIALARLCADVPASRLKEQVLANLIELVRTSGGQPLLQQSCILALGQLGDCDGDRIDTAIRAALLECAHDSSDAQSQYFAFMALARTAGRPGTGIGSPLAGLEGDEDPRAILRTVMRNGRTNARSWAALSLAVLEHELEENGQDGSLESKAALRVALARAKAPAEIGALAIAVGLARDSQSTGIMRDVFKRTSEPEARGFVAIGLGLLGDRASTGLIVDVARKSRYQPDMLKSVGTSLALLGDREIVPELVSMLGAATGLSSLAGISSALATIGDVRSIDALIALLEDEEKSDRARGFAAAALGMIADKQTLPWNAKFAIGINYRATTPTLTSFEDGSGILDLL